MTTAEEHGANTGFVNSASFFMPERIILSHWLGHVPFASWLIDVMRPGLVVELGTLHGCSYLTFCQALERNDDGGQALGIDTWKGDEHTGFYGEHVFEQLRSYHDPRYGWFSTLVRSTFDEALEIVQDGTVDLLHIDGLHFYESVRHDFESWRPKLSERAVVLFHDTQEHGRGFGVARLWSELTDEFPGFEFVHDSGLGVLGVGPSQSERVAALLAIGRTASARSVRTRYEFLGSAVRHAGELAVVRQDNARLKNELRRGVEQIESMRQSTSWRVTAPLRRARALMR